MSEAKIKQRTFMISLKDDDRTCKKRVGSKDGVASSRHGKCRLNVDRKRQCNVWRSRYQFNSYWTRMVGVCKEVMSIDACLSLLQRYQTNVR